MQHQHGHTHSSSSVAQRSHVGWRPRVWVYGYVGYVGWMVQCRLHVMRRKLDVELAPDNAQI